MQYIIDKFDDRSPEEIMEIINQIQTSAKMDSEALPKTSNYCVQPDEEDQKRQDQQLVFQKSGSKLTG